MSDSPPTAFLRYAKAAVDTARNAAEVVRFGGLETGEQPSPYDVVEQGQHHALRRYFPAALPTGGLPVVLIPPLMMTSEVWDVSPASSAVVSLHEAGTDVWVVDFGDPGRAPGGQERTLTDHVVAVSAAVDKVHEVTGRNVVLTGYSQGGMFAYQAAAYRRGAGIDSVVTFGAPVDIRAPLPVPVSPEVAARLARSLVESGLLRHITLPGWASRTGFKLLSPAKTVQGRVSFLLALHDREALLPRERQRRFLDSEGFTAWSGPAIAELLEQFVSHNRMLEGGFVIEDRLVTLADLALPILTVVGSTDSIGHPDSVRAIRRAAPRAQVYELTVPTGHFGLVVGSSANARSWPGVVEWARWRSAGGELGGDIVRAEDVPAEPAVVRGANASAAALVQAAGFGVGAGRIAVGTAKQALRMAKGVLSEAPAQLTRLARAEHLDPTSRISLGLLLDEQAKKSPGDVTFLFGDRAFRQAEVKHRVDSIVKGLLSVGIRHGDRVGVLMTTRPSAFTLVSGLSRLGATAVLLRPDGELAREAALGKVSWVVTDPEHVARASELPSVTWLALGGGADPRLLPGVIDLERIDPDQIVVPSAYRANPHQGRDLAFVMFTGEGAGTRAIPITNRRWAQSALGTAAAAALEPGDTVYSTTPIHHSSALLMSVGGAIAGGARFAMATADDPDTFWDEVRRYGVTHVSYTWTSLHAITAAAVNAAEAHHPIRMFMGSGMPRNLWQRVGERFPGTQVLEFYASAGSSAILANLKGEPVGSLGRSLPGTTEVKIAAYSLADRALEVGPDGLGRECSVDEVGLLLSRVTAADPLGDEVPLRSVFASGDCWRSSGDLFLRDERRHYWRVDSVAALVDTAHGTLIPAAATYALGTVPAVDLCVAYGVPDCGTQLLVAATTLRPKATLTAKDLAAAFAKTPKFSRPEYVHVVKALPVTTWHRPLWRGLQAEGIPRPVRGRTVWRLAADRSTYELVRQR